MKLVKAFKRAFESNQQAEVAKDSGRKLPKVPPKDCESVH